MTIAFGQVFWFIAIKTHSVTGGEDGLLKIARLPADLGVARFDLSSNVALYYFALAAFALVLIGLWRLVNSPFGRVLQAIRQNETRVTFLGYGVWPIKVVVFTLSAAISGFAGALFAMAQTSAFPDVMSLHHSGYIVMMTLVGGGLVSFWGPVIGVFAFLLTRDIIGALTTAWMFWFGLFFVLVVLFKPEGIAGLLRDLKDSWMRRNFSAPAAAPSEGTGEFLMALFEARGLHMRFGRRVVLERVDLSIEQGMFAGIIGPNGAGKTTCFNVLTGRFRPSRGKITFAEEDITGLAPEKIARKGIARSFQIMTLFDEYSARDNVIQALPEMRAMAYRMGHAVARDRFLIDAADEVLDGVGLLARADIRAKDLSYGDRRALEIAVALGSRPRILFLDEPTSGLGASGRARLRTLLEVAQGQAHDLRHRARSGAALFAGRPGVRHPMGPGDRRGHARGIAFRPLGAPLQSREAAVMLELSGIDVFYGETQALFDVSLGLERGEVVALLGPNGAGKTTTLRAILGLTPARHGRVRFEGIDITRKPTHEIARLGVGWVPDDRRICPTLTVARNLSIAVKRTKFRSWKLKEVTEIFTALDYLMDREAETLSGGEMQMVAISRALLGAPGLVLFDEPSQGLAPKVVLDVLATIERLKAEGVAAIVVEQNADVALAVADRVLILDNGRIAWTGSAAQLREDSALKRRLLGE